MVVNVGEAVFITTMFFCVAVGKIVFIVAVCMVAGGVVFTAENVSVTLTLAGQFCDGSYAGTLSNNPVKTPN